MKIEGNKRKEGRKNKKKMRKEGGRRDRGMKLRKEYG